MAQLKDTTIVGNLDVDGAISLQNGKAIKGIHPDTGDASNMLYLSTKGNTIINYDGYKNENGNTEIYGKDVIIASSKAGNVDYRPYRRAGDSMNFNIRTSGYVTNNGKDVVFTLPMSLPILGAPVVTAVSNNGFLLRQDGYVYGSNGASNPPIYAKPARYDVYLYWATGLAVVARFDNADLTGVKNNSPIGIHWSGTVTFS